MPPTKKSKKTAASRPAKSSVNGKQRVSKSAKKKPAKTAARSSTKVAQKAPVQNRFAGEPRVFRFWQDASGFLVYAGGLWAGQGVHGDPEKDGEYKSMRARFGADGLEISILTVLPAPKRKGLLGLFRKQSALPALRSSEPARKSGTEAASSSTDKTRMIHFPATTLEADVDLAAWQHGDFQLDIQAIDAERMYLVLRSLGADGRIEFAGPVGRD